MPRCLSALSVQLLKRLSALSVRVPKCLKSQNARMPSESLSALQVPECPPSTQVPKCRSALWVLSECIKCSSALRVSLNARPVLGASVERWALDAGLWTLYIVSDWFRTESEFSFWFWLHYTKFFEWKSLRSHDHAYSVESKSSDVVIFRNFILMLYYIDVITVCELHYKQLSHTVNKQPSTAIHLRKFLQKIRVLESFF